MSIPPPPGPHQPQDPQGQYPAPQGPYAPPSFPQQPPSFPQQQAAWHPYPYPYGYPPQPPVNGVAIAALVFGVLCLLPAIGLVLGVIALVQIKRKGQRGKGMAVAGTVLSSVGVLLWAVSLGTGAASSFWEGVKEGARDGASFSLDKGDCFDTPSGSLQGVTYDVDDVPCSGEHDGEVFGTIVLPDGGFPNDDRLTEIADEKCYALQGDYALDAWAVPDHVDVYYFSPTSQSWRLGDREITCVFGNTDEHGSLTGSLRNDGTTLGADQLAYLEAVRAIDAVLETEPEAYPEDDLPGNRAWADDVHEVLGEQTGVLREHAWRPDAERSLTALVKELEKARAHWEKAGAATDADTFYVHYDEGYGFYDGEETVTAREALGLDTSPPSYDYDDGSGDRTEEA
ncbi:DUF4190 domain-containing protein [Streptomyces sp. NPDC057877]|uniref:DUF4190 domain-containing protein n=1 Tax=Streptomyces sp. NPDC057877 TaxID=3346269 RepID=UPI00369467D5